MIGVFGYLTWRQCYGIIITFVRNREFSNTVVQAEGTISAHATTFRTSASLSLSMSTNALGAVFGSVEPMAHAARYLTARLVSLSAANRDDHSGFGNRRQCRQHRGRRVLDRRNHRHGRRRSQGW